MAFCKTLAGHHAVTLTQQFNHYAVKFGPQIHEGICDASPESIGFTEAIGLTQTHERESWGMDVA